MCDNGTTLLAYQAYPDKALGGPRSGLFLSHHVAAKGGKPAHWSAPAPFLEEACAAVGAEPGPCQKQSAEQDRRGGRGRVLAEPELGEGLARGTDREPAARYSAHREGFGRPACGAEDWYVSWDGADIDALYNRRRAKRFVVAR